MEEQLRSLATAVLHTLTPDQLRLVLDYCLDLREQGPLAPREGLEQLLEEPS